MDKKLRQIFKNINYIETPVNLEGKILASLKKSQEKAEKQRLWFSYVAVISSFFAVFYTLWTFGGAILKSQFWSLATLAFSDAAVIISHWNDYLLSLLETLPVFQLAAIILPLAILFGALNFCVKIEKEARHRSSRNMACL